MKKVKKYIPIICICLFIILDQLSKIFFATDFMLIDGAIKLSNVHNTGGAFGIFSTSVTTIIIMNVILLGMIIRFIILKKDYMSKSVYISLLIITAGGISNLIDRIFRGYVVDFIDINQIISFPVFNFADVVLVIGWGILAVAVLKDIINNK